MHLLLPLKPNDSKNRQYVSDDWRFYVYHDMVSWKVVDLFKILETSKRNIKRFATLLAVKTHLRKSYGRRS